MSRRNRNSHRPGEPALEAGAPIDLRAAARALLAGERQLAIEPAALGTIREVAGASSPVMAAQAPEPQARRGEDLDVRGGVAIVPLQGIITPRGSWLSLLFGGGSGGLQGFRRDLRAAIGHPDVEAVVLDVHSPGGSIGLVPETAAEVRNLRGSKPIVAVCNTMAASAAYWIAAQADELVATPSGLAGSIGVYVLHEDWSGWNEAAGIDPTYVYAGRYKVEGNPDEPLEGDAKAALQREVDDLYGMFVNDVALGRRTSPDAVRAGYGEGRVLPAARAKSEDLIDRVATIDETVRDLAAGGAGRIRAARASDPAPNMRAEDEVDKDGPKVGELTEEARSRIAELRASLPDPSTL